MAQPPDFNTIRKDDVPEAPAWLEKLLGPLNRFMLQVKAGLSRNLTVKDNLAAAWVTVPVIGGTLPKPVAVDLGSRAPYAVLLAYATGSTTAAITFEWTPTTVREAGGRQVPAFVLTRLEGITTNADATLRFLVLAE